MGDSLTPIKKSQQSKKHDFAINKIKEVIYHPFGRLYNSHIKKIKIKKQINAQELNNFVKKKKLHLSLHLGETLELPHRKINHQKPTTQIF